MTMSILKRPQFLGELVPLRKAAASSDLPVDQALSRPSPLSDVEQKLRREMEAELQTRLTALSEEARDKGFQQGYEEGLSTGHADGQATGKDSFKTQLGQLERILTQADESITAFWASTADMAEKLALEAVMSLLGEHALDAGVIVGQIRQVCRRLHDSDIVQVRMHPVEQQRLRQAVEGHSHATRLQLGRLVDRLVADPVIDKGGCVVQTTRGDYVGTFDVLMPRLYAALAQRRTELDAAAASSSGAACA